MKRNILYSVSILPALFCLLGLYLGSYYAWFNVIFVLLILPILELVLPNNKSNSYKLSAYPIVLLYLHVILIVSLFALFLLQINRFNTAEFWGNCISLGINSAMIGVVAAHDFVHINKPLPQFAGKLLLFLCGNIYFREHHLLVHHTLVGTYHDAATARKGESLYAFIIRSIVEQIKQAWQINAKLLTKKGKSNWRNPLLHNFLLQFIALVIFYVVLGEIACVFWIVNMLIAAVLLEFVNYIEHYGLQRNSSSQRITAQLSWNSNALISRYFLFDLSRHSDHHLSPTKEYNTLNSIDASPELPAGYASLIWLAVFPTLWRKIVHPRLAKFE